MGCRALLAPIGWLAFTATAISIMLSGCTAPEDSPWWTPEWEEELAAADRQTPDLPEATAFRLPGDPDAMLPGFEGDGPLELSLEDATMMALRYNRDLAVQQFNPVIAGTFERIERGVFDPEAFIEFEYAEQTTSEIDRGTGAQFGVDSTDTAAAAGLRQTLPGGTEIEVGVLQEREASNRAPEQQDARLGLTVTQQLLRGAGPAVSLVNVRQAKLGTRASVYELRGFTEALLAEVESVYWNTVLSGERIRIVQEALEVARRQRDDVEQRIALGALATADAAVARTEVALREQALIDATSELETQQLRLMFLVNPGGNAPLDRPLRLTTPTPIQPQPVDDLAERLILAESSRPDLAEARLRLEQDRLETIVTRNGVMPQLEVFLAIGKTGFADRFDDSFRDLDGDSYDLTAGVAFSKLLDNDTQIGQNQQAYATRQQSAAAVNNLSRLVALEVSLAANEVERARRQIDASTLTRQFQEETVKAERDRFEAGVSTALLVAQAQRDLLEAQINEVEAVVSYRLALIDLYLAEGSLLDRRGCVVSGTDLSESD